MSDDILDIIRERFIRDEVPVIDQNNLKVGTVIGAGAYGVVKKGVYDGKDVAIKELRLDYQTLKEKFDEVVNEIKFAQLAINERLPRFYGITVFKHADGNNSNNTNNTNGNQPANKIGLIIEFVSGKALNEIYSELNEKTKLDVIKQLLEALIFLHQKKLIHRDIKPQNIMYDKEKNYVRLVDFGVSKIAGGTYTYTSNAMGTAPYMAPENFDVDIEMEETCDKPPIQISSKSDVWSVGCVISELFSGSIPWGLTNNIAVENKLINKNKFPVPKNITNEHIKKLIEMCTIIEPSQRPNSSEVLEKVKEVEKYF